MLLQAIITLFALFAVSRSYLRFRRNTESWWEFLLWIVFWTLVIAIVFVPEITQIPANILGIGRGIDVAVYFGIVFLFYSTYRIYAKLEKVEQDITKLTREIALRKK